MDSGRIIRPSGRQSMLQCVTTARVEAAGARVQVLHKCQARVEHANAGTWLRSTAHRPAQDGSALIRR